MDVTASALYAAIHAQPNEARRLLRDGREGARRAADLLRGRRVRLVGIGTSFHAAEVGAWLLRAAGVEATALHSFEVGAYGVGLDPACGYILISHRGSKRYAALAGERIAAIGAPCVALTAQGAPAPAGALHLETVPGEQSSTHTVSYCGALVLLALIAAELGATEVSASLPVVPETMDAALAGEARVRVLANELPATGRIAFIGAGPNAVTAPEAALKLKEAAYVTAEGMAVEQYLHGPLVALGAGDTLVAVRVPGPGLPRIDETAAVARAIGVRVVNAGVDPEGGPLTVPGIERLPEPLTPIAAVVPLQLLALYVAGGRGTNPDSFRADDPLYQEAFARVTL
jgi:glucosamine--fructose-6-phosphate aminotransferase (isomerizing)